MPRSAAMVTKGCRAKCFARWERKIKKNRKTKPMKNETKKILVLALLLGLAGAAAAQMAGSTTPPTDAVNALQPLLDGLTGKYGWLTTLILCVGSLRILCKPLMLALENALQSDPEKLARLQKFE